MVRATISMSRADLPSRLHFLHNSGDRRALVGYRASVFGFAHRADVERVCECLNRRRESRIFFAESVNPDRFVIVFDRDTEISPLQTCQATTLERSDYDSIMRSGVSIRVIDGIDEDDADRMRLISAIELARTVTSSEDVLYRLKRSYHSDFGGSCWDETQKR